MILTDIMCWRYPFDVFKCGKCPECLQDKRREWSLRLQLHTIYSNEKPFFCHLTYDNKHVPVNLYGQLTLQKSDLQLFLKRLRSNLKKFYENEKIEFKSLKYFIAGEYGPNGTHRPHYHCIIFGLPEIFSEDEKRFFISKAWQNGDVRKKSCTLKSMSQIHYTTKYVINFEQQFRHKEKPFKICSSGLGLPFVEFALRNNLYNKELQQKFKCVFAVRNGKKFPVYWRDEYPLIISQYDVKVNPLLANFRDFVEISHFVNGKMKTKRYPLPRYFQDKLYTEDFRAALAVVKKFKLQQKNSDYFFDYHESDKFSDKPMWKQLKQSYWEKVKKTKKDKDFKKNINDFLND